MDLVTISCPRCTTKFPKNVNWHFKVFVDLDMLSDRQVHSIRCTHPYTGAVYCNLDAQLDDRGVLSIEFDNGGIRQISKFLTEHRTHKPHTMEGTPTWVI